MELVLIFKLLKKKSRIPDIITFLNVMQKDSQLQQTNKRHKFIFSTFAPRPVGLLSIIQVNMKPTLFTPLNARSEMTFQLTPQIPFCSAPSFQPPFWHITPFTIQSIPRKIKSWLHFLTEKVLLRNTDYRRKIGCEWFVILT